MRLPARNPCRLRPAGLDLLLQSLVRDPEKVVIMNAHDETSAFETVCAYLSWDHHRLRDMLQDALGSVRAGDWPVAQARYGEFADGAERHMRLEEEVVFPLFEAMTGMADGATAVLREEHRAMRRALALMRDAVGKTDPLQFQDGHRFLASVLPDHEAKEERIMFPMTDRILAERDRLRLTARLVAG